MNEVEYEFPQVEVRLKLKEREVLYSTSPINSPEKAIQVMADVLRDLDREMVCIVNMDIKNRPINFNVVSIGSINGSLVPMQNIFKAALLSNSANIMLLHTHPSGDSEPSPEDDAITYKLAEACKLMDVGFVDHVIIGCGTGDIFSYLCKKPEILRSHIGGVMESIPRYEIESHNIIKELRPMTQPEKMYCYSQSSQIRYQTGNIGYLRADMDTDGNGFYSSWNGFNRDWKTQDFKDEFDQVINQLRFGDTSEAFLANRRDLAKYCFSHPGAVINNSEFGFRANTDNYSYMIRLNPNRGEYNLYCYCYKKEWLDHHLQEAERGIRFIDSNYNNMFILPDGGKIKITYPDGEKREEICRFIDPTHVEVGVGNMNLFHICEFAERMESCRAVVEPSDREEFKPRKAEYFR